MDQTTDVVEPEFKDRRTGLMIFGIIGILFGVFMLMSANLMLVLFLFADTLGTAGQEVISAPYAPINIINYLALGIGWIWLGIGSIKTRRWARAIILICSWFWLVLGLLTMAFAAFYLPSFMERMSDQPEVDPSIMPGVMAFMLVMMGFFMVVAPLIFVLFYGSPHVKATCERRNPQPAWTDRCPLPVLAMVLWYLFGALWVPVGPLVVGVFPLLGFILEGLPAILASLIFAAFWIWLARGIYRLELKVWKISLAFTIIFGVSSVLTFTKTTLLDLYARMDLSDQEMEQVYQSGILDGPWLSTMMIISTLAGVGYLVFIRRYFKEPATL